LKLGGDGIWKACSGNRPYKVSDGLDRKGSVKGHTGKSIKRYPKRPRLNPPLKGEDVEWRQKAILEGNRSADVGSKAIV
jgi:hypothetical protein